MADVGLIRESLRRFNRRAGVLKSDPYGIGLSLSQSSALVDIERFGVLKSNDLVRLLHLDKSTVSRMLEVLQEKKLIQVKDDLDDRRSKNLTLTLTGKKAVKTIHEISNQSVVDVLHFLEKNEQKLLVKAFERLSHAVDQADQSFKS